MEVPYKSAFVRKYSRGNSITEDEGFKEKKLKVKFVNKWSIAIVIVALLLASGLTAVMLLYRPGSKMYKYRKERMVIRPPLPKFHVDKKIDCAKSPEICDDLKGLRDKYYSRLELKLKGKNVVIVDKDGYECLRETKDKFCNTLKDGSHGLTVNELKAISLHLVEEKIELDENFEVDTIIKFIEFTKKYERDYGSDAEYQKRYSYFRINSIYIETHNSNKDRMYTLGYNSASDLSPRQLNGGVLDTTSTKEREVELRSSSSYGRPNDPNYYPGKIFDWRDKGKIIPIRNQLKCGTCFAFAAADLLSAKVAIQENKLLTFSVQQLTDCAHPTFSCEGGGSHSFALTYASTYNMCTEEEYPYKVSDFICVQPNRCKQKYDMKVWELEGEDLEKHLETKGPFAIDMFAERDFMLYEEGIYQFKKCNRGNHAVVIVGHGFDPTLKVPYFIGRNSWGENWGEKGYFRVHIDYDIVDGKKRYYCGLDGKGVTVKFN